MRTSRKVTAIGIFILILIVFLYFTNDISYNSNGTFSFKFGFSLSNFYGINWYVFLIFMVIVIMIPSMLYWSVKE